MRIVSRVADQRDALCVSLKVCSIQAEQELRWIVALVRERILRYAGQGWESESFFSTVAGFIMPTFALPLSE